MNFRQNYTQKYKRPKLNPINGEKNSIKKYVL